MKTLLRIVGILVGLILVFVLYIQLSYQVDFSDEYPVDENLTVVITEERVIHGKYLALRGLFDPVQ